MTKAEIIERIQILMSDSNSINSNFITFFENCLDELEIKEIDDINKDKVEKAMKMYHEKNKQYQSLDETIQIAENKKEINSNQKTTNHHRNEFER